MTSSSRLGQLLGLVGVVLTLTACNPDPTSSVFGFEFLNDTPSAVTVRYCANARCSKAWWTEVVRPGGRLGANSSAEGFDEWYQFLSEDDGAVVGCKTFNFHEAARNLVVPISSATPCRS